jgi:hypothetical protein
VLPVTTTANSTAQSREMKIHGSGAPFLLALTVPGGFALLGLAGLRKRLRNWPSIAAVAVLVLIAGGALGCGGSTSGTQPPPTGGTPAGTYSIGVAISSSAHAATGYPALTDNATATLTVQ